MPDLEKVIYSIERCICHVPDACRDCYYDELPAPECIDHLMRDAHALLKAQEPVEPMKRIEENEWTVCGCCKSHIISKWSFCPYCGKAVKWE